MTCLLGVVTRMRVRKRVSGSHAGNPPEHGSGGRSSSPEALSDGVRSRYETSAILPVDIGITTGWWIVNSAIRGSDDTAVCGGVNASSVNYLTESKGHVTSVRRDVAVQSRSTRCGAVPDRVPPAIRPRRVRAKHGLAARANGAGEAGWWLSDREREAAAIASVIDGVILD